MKKVILAIAFLISACAPRPTPPLTITVTRPPTAPPLISGQPTPLPTRTRWTYADQLPYRTQPGDTLKAVALRFNTSPEAIQQLNPNFKFNQFNIFEPGTALLIPANYAPFMGTPYWILPDSEVVYGPSLKNFSTQKFLQGQKGFLSSYDDYADAKMRPAWEVIDRLALNYSLNPRLLIALVEYRSGAVTQNKITDFTYPLGYKQPTRGGLHNQLMWAADILSEGYYGWRHGTLVQATFEDGRTTRIDFWQNAGTAALHQLFAALMTPEEFKVAVSPTGFAATYQKLFGEPFQYDTPLFPANLRQPELTLPFKKDSTWSYTGAPHAVWTESTPWAAIDFAPPAVGTGCGFSNEFATAMSAGVVTRSAEATVTLDLDGDGDEGTGWVIFYFHLRADEMTPVGTKLNVGDPIGHPSCEGGRATGTHTHIARKYNGEWILANEVIPFVMSGWTVRPSGRAYFGSLTFDFPALKIEACECVSPANQIKH